MLEYIIFILILLIIYNFDYEFFKIDEFKIHRKIKFHSNNLYKFNKVNRYYDLNKEDIAILSRNNNIPSPKFKILNIENDIDKIINNLNFKFPIVIKPINESNSNGIIENISDKSSLKLNCKINLLNFKKVIIQEQAPGNTYIINIFNFKPRNITLKRKINKKYIEKKIDITKVSNLNMKLFEKFSKLINKSFCNIKYISGDINIPYTKNNGKILG